MKNIKVKVSKVNEKNLNELENNSLRKARAFFQCFPFTTKLYLSMKTGLSLEWIKNNWDKITN